MKSISKSVAIPETGFKGSSLSTSSIRSLLSRSVSSKHKSMSRNSTFRKSNAENTPPLDSNLPEAPGALVPPPKMKASSEVSGSEGFNEVSVKPELPVEKENTVSDDKCKDLASADPAVKVVVRIRPPNGRENGGSSMVKKVSSDTLVLGDRKFTFDSIFDARTSQRDIFETVGVPLVKDALAGYNTSILSYGQSGSGKTYTMWGPPSSMFEEPSSSSDQGLVPRIFQILFSEIEKEQEAWEGKQVNYQCRCSFLEIYNEKIGDLLDPTQRNLQIKDDPKNGLYVENLTEEYVTSYEDAMQMLIKGLSSRKVGATTTNSKSSRSHIIFTCVIESWCKDASSKCFTSSKTSRISLVDLAGSDMNKIDDPSKECTREAKNVKKSLSHLGHLVSALAKRSKVTDEDIPYKGSRLTHLLRESFGGNAKLTVICAISSENKNDSEILSTLRFGQRVKCVKNEPVINEITEEDMNGLSDQIRQLKEELIKAKSHGYNSVQSGQRYLHRQYARESLNQLRVSLNRSLMLPPVECDSEEEINIVENDVKELHKQLDKLETSEENVSIEQSEKENSDSVEVESCGTDAFSEDFKNCPEEFDTSDETDSRQSCDEVRSKQNITLTGSISVNSLRHSQILEEPILSESPKIGKLQRKSTVFSSSNLASRTNVSESSKLISSVSKRSLRQSQHIRSSLRTSQSLAASLQRGLELIDYHQRSSAASTKSPVAFSFEHLTLQPSSEVFDKTNASIQIENRSLDGRSSSFLCPSCQRRRVDSDEVEESLKTWIVPVDGKENELSEDKKRVQELESICKEQAAKIEQLNRQVEQYKLEKEQRDGQGSQILCTESPKNEILLLEQQKDEDVSFDKVIEENCEIREVQEELKHGKRSSSFDADEKEELLKEIHSLRSKLQPSYPDALPSKSIDKLRSSLLRRSVQLQRSISGGSQYNNSEEELQRERERWTEMESEWISLTDELRVDIETHRRRAEKLEGELRVEKNCTEELDDALHRAVLGHARMVEHYAELQEKYNDLVGKHRAIMEGIAEFKRAAAKAGAKGHGSRFAKSLAAELSAKRVEREKEREFLKKENQRLRIQLRDTAEAVHAAGELLVRLREAEQATSAAEENLAKLQEENDKLEKQLEKVKRKHKMEMITMKQYLAESKLPGSALPPLYKEDDYNNAHSTISHTDDDQAWREEFGPIYQDPY
ncbi:kinesin-like protein KIN-12F [Punica granatum]|uniref:Kinesin-like protein KIN-12F n=1 Tax=Punica granatum TaxID=22663 RepID=A0A218X8U5_PUNGR|nr:kinesin-like protein KIN-12F [Punica granatum]OWM81344.1 hypothetical protein CDL15_Pgr007382 [Punica granatum]